MTAKKSRKECNIIFESGEAGSEKMTLSNTGKRIFRQNAKVEWRYFVKMTRAEARAETRPRYMDQAVTLG